MGFSTLPPVKFHSADELKAAVGDHLGYSEWVLIDQDRIDTFAEATGGVL